MERGDTRKHVALVGALHGHALVHALDVEHLAALQLDLGVRHDVLHLAVDDVVPRVHVEPADDVRDAQARQQALVPVYLL